MHSVPSREFFLAVVEAGPFSLTPELPEDGVLKIKARGRAEVPVKATFKEGVQPGAIPLKADAPPKGFRIQAPAIPFEIIRSLPETGQPKLRGRNTPFGGVERLQLHFPPTQVEFAGRCRRTPSLLARLSRK